MIPVPIPPLPEGVTLRPLTPREDSRGSLLECFRESWAEGPRPVQWNLVRSDAGVFRGFHVHVRHWDYLLPVEGCLTLGLRDLRRGSSTRDMTVLVELTPAEPRAVTLPPGVAHGFWFQKRAIHLYAVSEYWDVDDELACHWADPAIGIDWPVRDPILSVRDQQAGTLEEMIRLYESRREEAMAASPSEPSR